MESANAPPLPWEATKHKAFPSVSIEASSSAGEQRAKPPMELPRQLLKDELDKITRWQIGEAATARAGALPSCAPPPCLGALPGAVAAPAGWLPLSPALLPLSQACACAHSQGRSQWMLWAWAVARSRTLASLTLRLQSMRQDTPHLARLCVSPKAGTVAEITSGRSRRPCMRLVALA